MNRTCEIHDTILQDDLKLRERPLKILAAVDSFKGSMTSVQAGMAVKKGLEKNYKNCEIEVVPVADGGEGTMDAIAYGKSNMKRHTVNVTGPLGQVVKASYISYDEAGEKVALIEMAEAAGLPLVPESARNPMHTTTYGVGEMIKDAMLHGCRSFIIGIGGSATNDAGIGMLQALGCHFLDEHGNEVCYGAEGLSKVCGIHIEDIAGMTDIEEARNRIQEIFAEENTPYFLTAVYRRHLESSDAVDNIEEKDGVNAADENQETETTKHTDENDTEKLEQQVQDIEDDMEQMQSEVQMYSPIMPSFRQVVQNADAGEFAWSLHGRVDDANQYSKTSRYLLAKMETYGAHPADITESISGCLGGNYYFKSQYVVFDNDIYYIVSAMYADPFGWHTEGIWLFYGGLAVVFLIIIATILTAFISCRRTFSQMEDAERKETVITALAHDVKSPLMAISGYAENLKQLNQTGECRHYIDVILENTSYMNELLCQLSEYIKLGKMEALQTESVSIEQIWEPLQERYQNLLDEKGLEVRMSGNCTVKGDPLMLSHMLENLFVNAIKYSLKGSVIRLVLKEDHLILSNPMEQPITTDPEELWKPFVKGDEARTGRSGSGIGLSIVQEIMQIFGYHGSLKTEDGEFEIMIYF